MTPYIVLTVPLPYLHCAEGASTHYNNLNHSTPHACTFIYIMLRSTYVSTRKEYNNYYSQYSLVVYVYSSGGSRKYERGVSNYERAARNVWGYAHFRSHVTR